MARIRAFKPSGAIHVTFMIVADNKYDSAAMLILRPNNEARQGNTRDSMKPALALVEQKAAELKRREDNREITIGNDGRITDTPKT